MDGRQRSPQNVVSYAQEGFLPQTNEELIVYRDNLYFDEEYISKFIREARKGRKPVRAAFYYNDEAFIKHALPLSTSYQMEYQHGEKESTTYYLADLLYYPKGPVNNVDPLKIRLRAAGSKSNQEQARLTKSTGVGYSFIPQYMAPESGGDLSYHVPDQCAMMAIDCWVHVFVADIIFGQLTRAERYLQRSNTELMFKLQLLWKSLYEGRQFLRNSMLVKTGSNCTIHPGVIINGPAIIGNNVIIEEGTVIENCIIGNNVRISQGCQLMLSVVGDGAFLPFGAKLFMTTLMDNSTVAQNTCLQLCVIGRNTFVGAGSTFTDYNLIQTKIRAMNGNNKLVETDMPILGSCVGHNCRIGSGMVIYPARMIESDVVLAATRDRRIIDRNITYEESDHHKYLGKGGEKHKRQYPRQDENVQVESW